MQAEAGREKEKDPEAQPHLRPEASQAPPRPDSAVWCLPILLQKRPLFALSGPAPPASPPPLQPPRALWPLCPCHPPLRLKEEHSVHPQSWPYSAHVTFRALHEERHSRTLVTARLRKLRETFPGTSTSTSLGLQLSDVQGPHFPLLLQYCCAWGRCRLACPNDCHKLCLWTDQFFQAVSTLIMRIRACYDMPQGRPRGQREVTPARPPNRRHCSQEAGPTLLCLPRPRTRTHPSKLSGRAELSAMHTC